MNWTKNFLVVATACVLPILVFELWSNINAYTEYSSRVNQLNFLNSNLYASIASSDKSAPHITDEFNVTYHSNELGFRGDSTLKNADTTIVGDSYVWGTGVDANDHFINILKNQNHSVNNFGLPTAGTINELLIIRDFAAFYTTKKVILIFYPNDIQNNAWWVTGTDTNLELEIMKKRHLHTYNPYPHQPAIRSYLVLLFEKILSQHKNNIEDTVVYNNYAIGKQHINPTSNWSAAVTPEPDLVTLSWKITFEALAKIQNRLSDMGLDFEIVYLPYQEAISETQRIDRISAFKLALPAELMDWDLPGKKLEIWCNKNNVPFYNVTDVFRKSTVIDKVYYPHDGHLTPTGHRLLAQYLDTILAK